MAGVRGVVGRVTLALTSGLLALVACEGLLQLFTPDAYYPWAPHTRMAFHLPPGRAPGIREARFSTNADGIRGETFSAAQRYRILAIGGSTTECLLLDDSLAWPHLLEAALNQRIGGEQVWVGNAGKSGTRAAHHQLSVRHLLPRYPRIDAVIVLVGINDLTYRLAHDAAYRPDSLTEPDRSVQLMQLAFEDLPRRFRPGPPYKRTEIWTRLRELKLLVRSWMGVEPHLQDPSGNNLVTWRRHRQIAGRLRDTLPDLRPAVEAYRRRLNAIIDEAAQFNADVILVTQPVLWKPGLPPRLRDLLWLGGVGDYQAREGNDYYAVEALAPAMDWYNQTLLQVCRDRGVGCIDLAAALPQDTTIFYDDAHFNEAGSRRVSEVIADYFLAHSTLGGLLPAPRQAALQSRAGVVGSPAQHRLAGPDDQP